MFIILAILGTLIVALLIRQLLLRAPKNGKPFLFRITIVILIVVAVAMAMRGLWPVAISVLGGLIVYGRPILQAFGLWKQWQHGKQQSAKRTASGSPMDKATARKIIGVSENATQEEILAAYKTQMSKNHPDKGGSNFLASQINQAKDVLLDNLY